MNDENFKEKDYYKEKIIEMVEKINNQSDLEMLYGVAKAAYKDAGKEKAEER